jgi:hypothetical protein
MSVSGFLRTQIRRVTVPRLQRQILSQPGPELLGAADWERSLQDPTAFYLDCYRFFHQRLPKELREHRAYFCNLGRGFFNEDAMHVMWWTLFQEFRPGMFLEIGVYRGQTISLAAMLTRENGIACEVHGISPFTSAGDAVSKYREDLDYLRDTRANFEHFGLSQPTLLKAFSADTEAVALIRSKAWDMIYIDGNHDYEVAKGDWKVCSQSVRPGGAIVLDDSALQTAYQPPVFATAGHPGPSRLAGEIDRTQFREILRVGHNRVFQKKAG